MGLEVTPSFAPYLGQLKIHRMSETTEPTTYQAARGLHRLGLARNFEHSIFSIEFRSNVSSEMQLLRIVYRYLPFVNLHIIVRRNGFGSHSTVHTTFGTVEDTLDVSDNRLNEVPNKLYVDSTYLVWHKTQSFSCAAL